jgi:hypothetical protein
MPKRREHQTIRRRAQRPFPAASFQEALEFAQVLFTLGSGQPVRRLTVFDHLGTAPESGASRMLITNSSSMALPKVVMLPNNLS